MGAGEREDTPGATLPAQATADRLRHALELVARLSMQSATQEPLETVLGSAARALVQRLGLHCRIELEGNDEVPAFATEAARAGIPTKAGLSLLALPIQGADRHWGTLTLVADPEQPLLPEERQALDGVVALLGARLAQQRLTSLVESQREEAERLLATVSHELSSPLAAVLFNVELCVSRISQSADEVPPGWVENRLKRTRDAVAQVRTLVNGILGVTQIRSGRVPLHRQAVNLSQLVTTCLTRMADELEWSGCDVRTEIEPDVVGQWDAMKIEILVTNLISNAMKFGAEKPIEVSVRTRAGEAQLRVSDQGPGIRAEQRARLFQQFSRDSHTRAPGSGLGLWIAHSYVEVHRGTISLESVEGRGATFTVTLPLQPPA